PCRVSPPPAPRGEVGGGLLSRRDFSSTPPPTSPRPAGGGPGSSRAGAHAGSPLPPRRGGRLEGGCSRAWISVQTPHLPPPALRGEDPALPAPGLMPGLASPRAAGGGWRGAALAPGFQFKPPTYLPPLCGGRTRLFRRRGSCRVLPPPAPRAEVGGGLLSRLDFSSNPPPTSPRAAGEDPALQAPGLMPGLASPRPAGGGWRGA